MAQHITKHAIKYALKKGGEAALKSAAKQGIKTVAKEMKKSNSRAGSTGLGAAKIAMQRGSPSIQPVILNLLQYIVLPGTSNTGNVSTNTEDCKTDNKQSKLVNTSPHDTDLSVCVDLYIIDSSINYNALKCDDDNNNGMYEYKYKYNDIIYNAIFKVIQHDCVKVTISQLKLNINSTITVNDIRQHVMILQAYLIEQIESQHVNTFKDDGMDKSNNSRSGTNCNGDDGNNLNPDSGVFHTSAEQQTESRLFDLVFNGNILLNTEDKLVSAVRLHDMTYAVKKYGKANMYIEIHALFMDQQVVNSIKILNNKQLQRNINNNNNNNNNKNNNNNNVVVPKTIEEKQEQLRLEEKVSDCKNSSDDCQKQKIPENVQCVCGCQMVPTTPEISSLSQNSDINCKNVLKYHCWMYGCQNENKINNQDIMFECRNYKFHNYAAARSFNNNNNTRNTSITLCLTCARFMDFLKESLDKNFVSMSTSMATIDSKCANMIKLYCNILMDQVSDTNIYTNRKLNLHKNFKQTRLLRWLLLDYTKKFHNIYSLKINTIKTAKQAMSKCIVTEQELMHDYHKINNNLTPRLFITNVNNSKKFSGNIWFKQIVKCICENQFLFDEILKKPFKMKYFDDIDNVCKQNDKIEEYIKEYQCITQQLLINKSFVIIDCKSNKWVKDSTIKQCNDDQCQVMFGLTNRKHHCRVCGCIVCSKHIIDRNFNILSRSMNVYLNTMVDSESEEVIRMCEECSRNKVNSCWFGTKL